MFMYVKYRVFVSRKNILRHSRMLGITRRKQLIYICGSTPAHAKKSEQE